MTHHTPHISTCPSCSSAFTQARTTQRYCSVQCRQHAGDVQRGKASPSLRRGESLRRSGATKAGSGSYYLNGVLVTPKSLKTKAPKLWKIGVESARLEGRRRKAAEWSGYDGHYGCTVYLFTRALKAKDREDLRLRTIERGVYCAADAPARDQHHHDRHIAARAIDEGRNIPAAA